MISSSHGCSEGYSSLVLRRRFPSRSMLVLGIERVYVDGMAKGILADKKNEGITTEITLSPCLSQPQNTAQFSSALEQGDPNPPCPLPQLVVDPFS